MKNESFKISNQNKIYKHLKPNPSKIKQLDLSYNLKSYKFNLKNKLQLKLPDDPYNKPS